MGSASSRGSAGLEQKLAWHDSVQCDALTLPGIRPALDGEAMLVVVLAGTTMVDAKRPHVPYSLLHVLIDRHCRSPNPHKQPPKTDYCWQSRSSTPRTEHAAHPPDILIIPRSLSSALRLRTSRYTKEAGTPRRSLNPPALSMLSLFINEIIFFQADLNGWKHHSFIQVP